MTPPVPITPVPPPATLEPGQRTLDLGERGVLTFADDLSPAKVAAFKRRWAQPSDYNPMPHVHIICHRCRPTPERSWWWITWTGIVLLCALIYLIPQAIR